MSNNEGAIALSVVLPVRNMAGNIDDQLNALSRQTGSVPFEVIVVDDGSTDGSGDRAQAWTGKIPRLTVTHTSRRLGIGHARNVGSRIAVADCIAYCDADDIVEGDWVATMAAALETHPFVAGGLEFRLLNPDGSPDGPAPFRSSRPDFTFPVAIGANMGIHRALLEQVGWWDEGSVYGGDTELSLRLREAGFLPHVAPDCIVHRRLRPTGGQLFWQFARYGTSTARCYKRFRGMGWSRRSVWRLLWDVGEAVCTAPFVLDRQRRHVWLTRAGFLVGRLRGSLLYRVLYP